MTAPIVVERTSRLAAPPGPVWAHASSMAGVNLELAPFVRMTHPTDRDRLTGPQVSFTSWLLAFGLVPFDRHSFRLLEVADSGREGGSFREDSRSWMQARWRHDRDVVAEGSGSRVTDRLEVTPRLAVARPLVAALVGFLFTHRHRRLRDRFGEERPGPDRAARAPGTVAGDALGPAQQDDVVTEDGPMSTDATTPGEAAGDGTRGDLRWASVPALVRDAAERHGTAEAVVDLAGDEPVRLDWAELRRRVDNMAKGLIAAGVEPGDRVAIWAPNCWEWVVAVLGLQSAGAALVPLNTRYKGLEATDILARSRARLLFTVEGFLGNDYVSMLDAAGRPDTLEGIVLLRDTGAQPAGAITLDELLTGGDAVPDAELDARMAALDGNDVSDVLFTSGTTGAPKGVVQTHAATLRAFLDWSNLVGLRADDRYLIINPFFHTFGYKAGILACLMTGATMVPLPVFDVEAAIDAIEAERISMIPGPPTLYQTLLNHPRFDRSRVDTLRLAVTGAAVVPVELVVAMEEQLGFETVLTAYGLTEACGVVTVCRREDGAETIATTSGRAIPGVEVVIADPDGNRLGPDQPGEVLVRGYNVMREYFEDPEQTAEAVDPDGWLHTGDVGTLDARGYLRITDRTKDMFIVGGFNAYPAEIEQLLGAHPDIAQVAVVGVPDERMGEVGVAFVVPTAGAELDGDAVIAWAREHMANYKVPRRVEIIDALPLNASGKVLKFELRDRATSGS